MMIAQNKSFKKDNAMLSMHPTSHILNDESAAAQQCASERATSFVFCLDPNIILECFAKMLFNPPAIGHRIPLDHRPWVANREAIMRTRSP